MRPEEIVIEGIPVPEMRQLDEPDADLVSFSVPMRVPSFLGGDRGPLLERDFDLVMFRRTDRICAGYAVFEPEGGHLGEQEEAQG